MLPTSSPPLLPPCTPRCCGVGDAAARRGPARPRRSPRRRGAGSPSARPGATPGRTRRRRGCSRPRTRRPARATPPDRAAVRRGQRDLEAAVAVEQGRRGPVERRGRPAATWKYGTRVPSSDVASCWLDGEAAASKNAGIGLSTSGSALVGADGAQRQRRRREVARRSSASSRRTRRRRPRRPTTVPSSGTPGSPRARPTAVRVRASARGRAVPDVVEHGEHEVRSASGAARERRRRSSARRAPSSSRSPARKSSSRAASREPGGVRPCRRPPSRSRSSTSSHSRCRPTLGVSGTSILRERRRPRRAGRRSLA